jgi:hypothetical protein
MDFNIEEEEKKYLNELNSGEYYIELNPNDGSDHDQKEQRDLEAFKEDIKSESSKSFIAEALS